MTSVPKLKPVAPPVHARTLESQIGHTPLLSFRSITAHLPDDVASKIFRDNARRLLNLS